ncbi:hypothetical protein C2G38_2192216 [Gigaspora rosea]|uniref:Uncharacterized protein n=1 Tax=Gigaspora rosea TaxID=44941 RepID=A0A397V0U5_9GLOM|nr:hypothetical protein C2G38_2192216 [Gigaspora rosea]
MRKWYGGDYYASSVRSCMAAIWRHLNMNSVMEKPVDILNPKVYFELNEVINRKLKNLTAKGLGEHVGADGLMLKEVKQILDYPTMQHDIPEGLFDSGLDVKLFRSKTNQRDLNNPDTQAEELRYSDSVVILITRHKSQKGLAAYEHLKEVMQHEGLNRFVNALKQISKASGDYNNNDKPSDYNNHDVPDDYKALKEQQEVAPTFVNAFDSLEVFPDESSYVLGEHDQNILETDDQNKKAKGEKKDDQKEEVMGGKMNLKNQEFLEKFLSGNTFNNSELIVSNRDPITSASTVILKASGKLFVGELFVGELYCQ